LATDRSADFIAATYPTIGEDVPPPAEADAAESDPAATIELFSIPNFRADQETLADYEQTLAGVIAQILAAAITAVRETHTARRKELEADVTALELQVSHANVASNHAVARYMKVTGRKRRSLGLTKPTLFEQLKSFFRAGRAYRVAMNAEKGAAASYARLRDGQAAVDKHNRRLENLINSRELELRRYYNSDAGKASLVRQPYLRSLIERVDAIRAERAAYDARLAAGEVGPEEQRAREMARDGYAFLDGNVSGAFFIGQVAYQIYSYHIVRDREGRDWLVDFDPRYKALERLVLDIRTMADGTYTVRRSSGPDPRVGGTVTAPARDTRAKLPEVDPLLRATLAAFAQNIH
jgi:hypothetical protein